MQERLAGMGPDVSVRNMPLREAVWFLQDAGFGVSGEADIDLDAQSLRAAAISPDVPVRIDGKNIPLGLAIVRLTSAAGAGCRADDDLVHVCSLVDSRSLQSFERPPDGRNPADVQLSHLLRRRPGGGPLSLSQTTFEHALQKLGNASGVMLTFDRAALGSVGIEGGTPVSVNVRNASAANMLALVLRDASPGAPLQFRAQGGIIRISTRDQFDAEDRAGGARGAVLIVALAIAAIVFARAARKQIKRLVDRIKRPVTAATAVLVVVVPLLVARASTPVEVVAFSRRMTLDASRVDLRVWLSPADLMSPYRERDAAARARALAPFRPVRVATVKSVRGFQVLHRGWPHEIWLIRIRCAAAAALTGGFPLLWLARYGYTELKLRHRIKGGLCLACGYDLRFTPGRCPECGAEREKEYRNAASNFCNNRVPGTF
jgi:hypothetical protein